MDKDMKYGVTIIADRVYVEPIKENETSSYSNFNYVIEIIPIENYKGNGLNLLKIYSNGDLEVIQKGKWKIPPIIRMPFNYCGYYIDLELIDINDISVIKKRKPDVTQYWKVSFISDIQWIFDTLLQLISIEDKEHFELLEQIREVNKNFNYWLESPIRISVMKKSCADLDEIINQYENQKERLNEEQCDYLKTVINELVALINRYKLVQIE